MEACRAIRHRWTLRALVAAYLDLAVAYLFLCAASLAFFLSKILSFVGLSLPCSCDLFAVDAYPQPQKREHQQQLRRGVGCLQGFLVDYPTGKIAGVFDSVCGNLSRGPRNENFHSDGRDGGGAASSGLLKMGQGDKPCGPLRTPPPLPLLHLPSEASKKLCVPGPVLADGGESFSYAGRNSVDLKGKAAFRQGHANVCKRRRIQKNTLSVRGDSSGALPSSTIHVGGKGVIDCSPLLVDGCLPRVDSSAIAASGTLHHVSVSENDLVEEVTSVSECHTVDKAFSDGSERVSKEEKNESAVIEELKKALEEERSARVALNLELEKEWSAAASATDEAMAMIARLQEEKSALKMETQQHLRMMEEKSVYDSEEMEILKEIIVRREREKHVLEKEVESYKQIIFGSEEGIVQPPEELPDVAQLIGQNVDALFGSFDDPEPMLKEVYESIKKKERFDREMQHVDQTEPFMEPRHINSDGDLSLFSSFKKHHHPGSTDDGNLCNVLERTMEVYPDSVQNQKSSYEDQSRSPRSAHLIDQEVGKQGRKIEVQSDTAKPNSHQVGTEASILDVHVIDDKSDLNMHRSSSEKLSMDASNSRSSWLELRRVSMPEIDNERFILESEVDLLRKRLKEVQQGREKLSFSADQREKEEYSLNRLEEISHQLREIKRTTESGKITYTASLPPLSKGKFS